MLGWRGTGGVGVFSQKGKVDLVHNYLTCETQVESSISC